VKKLNVVNAMSIEQQRKKIHPHKFTLWVAIGSIVMMFAGLTSAYIVKRSQANWALLEMPRIFWVSTGVILLSSLTIYLAQKAFGERQMRRYRQLLGLTALLGVLFIILQIIGFAGYEQQDIRLTGAGSNASYSFLLAIAALHGVHVLGGVIALIVMYIRATSAKSRNYSAVPIDVASTYWHFVDLLWIYLFIFFSLMK
jgi:cytochrome c oxidase subunit III